MSSPENAPSGTEPPPVETPVEPSETELLRRQLEDTTAKLRAVSKAFQDQQKEMGAFRERFEQANKARAERQALELVRAFFDPVMNLKRSLAVEAENSAQLVEGLRLVYQQFHEALVKLGLEEVGGVGSLFNPAVHEAVGAVDVADRAQDGRVVEVFEDGYHVRGQALKVARVSVGRYSAGEA